MAIGSSAPAGSRCRHGGRGDDAGLRRDRRRIRQKCRRRDSARAGRIDLLVNNAGVGLLGGAEESTASEQAKALFDVNVFGTIRMTNAVLPVMRGQQKGRIINLSSILGLIPAPFNALYASTKHAVEGYSESLDHEVRTQGIRVVLVEPGLTRTAFEENLTRADRPLSVYDAVRADAERLMRESVAKGDAPEVVAEAVLKAANAALPKRRYTAGKMAGQVRSYVVSCPKPSSTRTFGSSTGFPPESLSPQPGSDRTGCGVE
jgi:short-subunit dehydrogenase